MNKLITTCEEKSDIRDFCSAGATTVSFVLEGCAFSTIKGIAVEEIADLAEEAHACGAQLQVLMNRLFLQQEIAEAQHKLDLVMEAGADTVVFADPGLLRHGLAKGYNGRMIYRSETMTTSANDVGWFLGLGLAGVMVSPLLTEEEISAIAGKSEHTGLVIHGYLPESISRRTLVEAFGTSIGREHLQDAKDLKIRELKREGRMPIAQMDFGTMIHTDYVQESFRFIKKFEQAGIEAFEINGEYLPKEAVLDAVEAYAAILKGADEEMISTAYHAKWAQLPLEIGYYGQKTVR